MPLRSIGLHDNYGMITLSNGYTSFRFPSRFEP